jgi:hypothetical protein
MSAFTDIRDRFVSNLGVSQQTQKDISNLYNENKSLIPSLFGGNIPQTSAGTTDSEPQATSPSFVNNLFAAQVMGIPVVILAVVVIGGAVYFARRK